MPITYISWAPHCSRSDATARELNGTSHMIYWAALGSHPATIWLKYIGQALATLKVLMAEKPNAVFVMTPPPVAILPVFVFCRLGRIPFVIDAHSGAFQNPRWRYFQRLQFWLARRAATTIVSNAHLAALLHRHGARSTIVPDVPVLFPSAKTECQSNPTVVCVTSFDRDEPVEAMTEAARRLPDVQFFMTGNRQRAERRVPMPLPHNLALTGFLDTASYGALIQSAHAVMALTTQDNTMQRGAYEAIYQGTPVIVSDFPILREAFGSGAAFVDNSPESIAAAISQLLRYHPDYVQGARALREQKLQRWRSRRAELLLAIQSRQTASR